MNKNIIHELIRLASALDHRGHAVEADKVDQSIKKLSAEYGSFDLDPQSEEHFDYENREEAARLSDIDFKLNSDAEELADLVSAGSPVTGHDEALLIGELTKLFSEEEYSSLTSRVMSLIRGE